MKGKTRDNIETKMKEKFQKSSINKKKEIDKIQMIGELEEDNKEMVTLGNKIIMIEKNIKEKMNKIIKCKEGKISKFIKKKLIEVMLLK